MGEVLGGAGTVLRPYARCRRATHRAVCPVASTAECDRPAAHGAHAEPDGDGHPDAVAPHARRDSALASRYGPRGHRHADDGERQLAAEVGPSRTEMGREAFT